MSNRSIYWGDRRQVAQSVQTISFFGIMTGNILEQAKQGNPNAIAALMSRSMKSQGIDVKASLDDRCLDVILEAAKVPTPQATVSFIRKGMTNLGVNSIDTVRVSAYQTGDSTSAWQEEIVLQEPAFSSPPPTVPEPGIGLGVEESLVEQEEVLREDLLDDGLESPRYNSLPEENLYNDDYRSDDYENNLPEEVTEFTPDEEYSASDYGLDEEESMEDEEGMEMEREETPKKKSSSALPLLLLLLAALGLGGYYLYSQKPELLAGIPVLKDYVPPSSSPETPEAAAPGTTPEATAPTSEAGSPAAATNDPFPEAVRKATSASQMAQAASTPEEWGEVAKDWQAAIEFMQAVPESNPNYSVAQDRIPVYQKNLEYAQQLAQ
ncbi:MAG: hypothetical protein WBB29_08450 [Geitlerinemataceae cyanobacterium]